MALSTEGLQGQWVSLSVGYFNMRLDFRDTVHAVVPRTLNAVAQFGAAHAYVYLEHVNGSAFPLYFQHSVIVDRT